MTTAILLSTFLISIVALLFFIVAVSRGWFDSDSRGARVIFAANEIGKPEDPAAGPEAREALQAHAGTGRATDPGELAARASADASTSTVVLVFMCSAVLWLLLGSFAGLAAAVKLHSPDWLGAYEWLSFGRIRTLHLNAVAYGFTALAGLGIAVWLLPRLLKTTLQGGRYALVGGIVWNVGLVAGLIAIATGVSDES
jgi:cytochrome c oxidase cbb3-type subunit 1